MTSLRIAPRRLFENPANFLALGAGLGLAPRAPGTFGTLLGIPLLLIMPQSLTGYLAALLLLALIGIWCCDRCARDLGVHDHPGIVWDEVVGYLITMIAMPRSALWILLGFALFRFFDVLKPWPISWIDRRVHGGLGIMLDDMLAALFSLAAMHLLLGLLS